MSRTHELFLVVHELAEICRKNQEKLRSSPAIDCYTAEGDIVLWTDTGLCSAIKTNMPWTVPTEWTHKMLHVLLQEWPDRSEGSTTRFPVPSGDEASPTQKYTETQCSSNSFYYGKYGANRLSLLFWLEAELEGPAEE